MFFVVQATEYSSMKTRAALLFVVRFKWCTRPSLLSESRLRYGKGERGVFKLFRKNARSEVVESRQVETYFSLE